VIAPCAVHIPINRIPAHVTIWRGRQRLRNPGRHVAGPRPWLQYGDVIRVVRPGSLRLSYAGNRFELRHAYSALICRQVTFEAGSHPRRAHVLALWLQSGLVSVRSGTLRPRGGLIVGPELIAYPTIGGTSMKVERNPYRKLTRAWTLNRPIIVTRPVNQTIRLISRVTYTAISDDSGLRLDVWPFALSASERTPVPSDGLVPFWDDGQACSVGCAAPGAIPGWPLKPFHKQHAIRSALNELRPANFHVALDIEARDGQSVYPIQSGYVHVRQASGPDENVQIGQFVYWHMDRRVNEGDYAAAYRTDLGPIKYAFKHLALSEIGPGGEYLNPLRPGGRMLSPWTDTEPPVIGRPLVMADGRAIVSAFDPQSVEERASYKTPVLAPAALAWRLFDAAGHALTPLEWALRGSHNYSNSLKPVIFAPGASNPGFNCFAFHVICIPRWNYWLAGGLTGPLPLASLGPGRYRLSVYAWDWAGNTIALDRWLRLPLAAADSVPSAPIVARPDFP
jgi:hypothetical protein